MERTLHWVPFLPLVFFVYSTRFLGLPGDDTSLALAFYIGSALALIYFISSWFRWINLDYMALGANLFLLQGGIASAFMRDLFFPHTYFMQMILFGWIFLVGVITTFSSPKGFIQMSESGSNLIASLALIGATAVDFLLSFFLITYAHVGKGMGLLLPLLLLITFREILRNYLSTKPL